MQCGPKVDVLLIAFLYLWLKFWEAIDKYWIVPVRKLLYFHHLFLSQSFSNGALVPLGGHGTVLWGPRAEAKTRYFYWWAGGHKCLESFEGGYGSWKFENHCSKWCWQVLLADPTIRGRTTGQLSPKFSKTCSVVSSVEYISWVRPCLLSKIKSWFVFSLKTMAI